MPDLTGNMFAPVKKPFLNVLAEDVRINPNQGVFENVGNNLFRAGDKMIMRNRYSERAQQMNRAMQEWQQQQAITQQRLGMQKTAEGGWGRFGKGLLNQVGQTGLGAGVGYGKSMAENAGYYDPNMSPETRSKLMWFNLGAGAVAGNPTARRRLFTKNVKINVTPQIPADLGGWRNRAARKEFRVANPPTTVSQTQGRPLMAIGALSATGAVPLYGNYADAVAKFGRGAQKFLSSDIVNKGLSDPDAFLKELTTTGVRNAARGLGESPAAIEAGRAFGGGFATNFVGGVGGALVGGAAGGLAGNLFAGDDEALNYRARRRRERLRSILGAGGTILGGVAAPYLLGKYAPGFGAGVVDKIVGPAAAPGAAAAIKAPAGPVNPTAGR